MTSFTKLLVCNLLISLLAGGLGARMAHCLSNAGAHVLLTGRKLDKLQTVASELNSSVVLAMNVAEEISVQNAFKYLEDAGERVDICINNAAIAKVTPIFELDNQRDFEDVMQTNIMGVWYVTKSAANHMKGHGIHGSIINIGSINGDTFPAQGGAAYSISKAAVIHLTKTLVGELSPHKIRINCISPGLFKTPMNEADIAEVIPYIPYGATPIYLASLTWNHLLMLPNVPFIL